ncbi:hypothetical protein AB0G67_40625 [Streptomyces sp. NPDC021056]|uniref:beta strand repeat-containing protein n=1 Tax=Streptomyces sp. NPDC021056 TaxID=3155012 RepID=UPI0034095475
MDIGRALHALQLRVEKVERSARLSHAAIDNTSVAVKDGSGNLRGIIGVQADGTTAVTIVNGAAPPQPSVPVVTSVLGGVTVTWDGLFTGGAILPLDWQRVEVHASTTNGFTPDASTLQGTIETPQGATVVVVTDDPVYVRLMARNTSGTASNPSTQVGPLGPTPVVADDILDGIVTEVKLANDAVTEAKIAAGAVGTVALQDGAVLADKLADAAVEVGKIANGAVLLNTLAGPLADTVGIRYTDLFRDPNAWAQLSASGGGTWDIDETATGTPSGGGKLVATGEVQVASKALIPQDSDTLYRVLVRVRATAQDPAGAATVYLGVVGVAQDGVTLVNRAGANSNTTQHYACSSGGTLGTADGWKTYVGWIQGHSATGATAPAGPATDPRSPELTHADVRYLRPMVWLNFGRNTSAVMEVEAVTVEAVRTGVVGSTNLISGSVTAGAIAADAVTAGKIATDAVTAREIAAGSVTAAEVAAGAITTDKLTVTGGANLLSDPSFESAYTAALVTGNAFWTVDPAKGNGSAKSLKVDATAGATTTRSLKITTLPILPGDQLFLAIDYQTSADYTPTAAVKFYARWEDATGAILGYGTAQASPPTIGGSSWTRIAVTGTAPASTVTATIWAESYQATAGSVWFDNAALRPVAGGTQIQDGAITTGKIVAGGVQATNIAAGAVVTDKLAAEAVTAAKIAALTITAGQIAANAITVGKLAAGSVDATALAADAITGKTITGGTITGALIQTAASGQRITLNELNQNKILVYNSSGSAINELSATGLLVKGTNGAILWLDPNNTFPNFKLTNATGTKSAVINISGADAVLGLNSGQFTGPDTFTDWKWRTLFGGDSSGSTDLWVAERVRESSPSTTFLGGRIFLANNFATFGYRDASAATSEGYIYCAPGSVTVNGSLTVTGAGQRTPKRRTSNAIRTSTITPTADTQLTWSVDANAVYALEGVLFYSGPGDFLMGWTFPSGTAGTWQGMGNGTTVVSGTAGGGTQQDTTSSWGYTVRTETTDLADNRTYGGISTTGFAVQVRATIRVGGTAGTFALQWAQGTSNATSTTLFTDSRLTLEKIG